MTPIEEEKQDPLLLRNSPDGQGSVLATARQAQEEKRRTVEAVFALAGGACYDRACFAEPSQGASAVTAFLGGRQASLEAPARGPMRVDLADKDEVNSLDVPGWSAEEIWSMMSNWLGGTP